MLHVGEVTSACPSISRSAYFKPRTSGRILMEFYIVAYLLKARTVQPEKQSLLGNARTQQ
jgi:hypothetical protein